MSGLPPTPLSERKTSLRSHSKAPGFNPVEEENEPSSGEEGRTQYDLAEEGDTMEVPSGSGRATGRDKQPERETPEATDSPDGTPCPTMPTMPTPSANGMITMTAADLLAFCQQMMMATHQNPDSNNDSGTPVNEQKQEIREYQKHGGS
ncbi:hypothetical protein EMCG_01849 [[Emmonsia] crescens]|uniref:Uncharacterized protein n=1 Tax=[Emmonsia] crescens TaxID=73230 RepID=A0A0G2HZS4_9EURO|nr:hypothetical protein EMCG_01849 [Emmonsia crescens UAMH 3008]